jgi:hypothetical protein
MKSRPVKRAEDTMSRIPDIIDYQIRWLNGETPNLDPYLDGLPKEQARRIRDYLEAWTSRRLTDGTMERLASRPPFKDRLAELHRRLANDDK